MKRSIVWHRRDLRMHDNTALNQALKSSDEIIPIFIFDDEILNQRQDFSPACVGFMLESLEDLERAYLKKSVLLVFDRGKPLEVLCKLQEETGASAIYFNEDYESYARKRDTAVSEHFKSKGVEVHASFDQLGVHPKHIRTQQNNIYTIFAPFKKTWLNAFNDIPSPEPFPKDIKSHNIKRIHLPMLEDICKASSIQPEINGGAGAGAALWQAFLAERIYHYKTQRDFPGLNATSRLSAYLRFGTISIRQLFTDIKSLLEEKTDKDKEGVETFLSELVWREFYFYILYHFPQVEFGSFKPDLVGINWENNPAFFEAWKAGQTGYPIVDAGMRQLNQTGWMHNRLRMIVASFLCKDLLIDWRWGELYFMQRLIDGDLALNNGGWQWAASTGTDAQPYFRIFNPELQSKKFDPNGNFIRQFVPELANLPSKDIHNPYSVYQKSPLMLERYGVKLGKDYPFPIVDHKIQRQKALKMYKL